MEEERKGERKVEERVGGRREIRRVGEAARGIGGKNESRGKEGVGDTVTLGKCRRQSRVGIRK